MSTAVKSRKIPVLLAVGALILGVSAYQVMTKPRGDGTQRVTFRAEWLPLSQPATLIKFGPTDPARSETRRAVKPVFEQIRLLRRGDIAEIDVEMPGGANVQGFTCRIFVEREAPKISHGADSRCHVAKYVP